MEQIQILAAQVGGDKKAVKPQTHLRERDNKPTRINTPVSRNQKQIPDRIAKDELSHGESSVHYDSPTSDTKGNGNGNGNGRNEILHETDPEAIIPMDSSVVEEQSEKHNDF
jgi:hypothetical protein